MKKERKNMYDIMIREKRNDSKSYKNFFLETRTHENENMKILISQGIVNSVGDDMQEFVDFMTKAILGGILNGRR